jgi:hypothetical protein
VLTPVSPSAVPSPLGTPLPAQLTAFSTDDPATTCLGSVSPPALDLAVYRDGSSDLVAAVSPADCVTAYFSFPDPG